MSGKIFDERGVLTPEGEKATARFKHELTKLLMNGSVNDLQIVGSILHKMVGDVTADAMQNKRNETNKFSAMSDDEFDEYLKKKYQPLYGEQWIIKASLTDEEGDRTVESFRRRMKEDEKGKPVYQPSYGVRLSPREKRYTSSPYMPHKPDYLKKI